MKKLFSILIASLVLTGCNTMQGFGKDVKRLGESVENSARR
ncbi:entericidin, EcnA/B family [Noviherbaspirillum cavernae]|uniref:Type IV secretion system putative lipoprotein virB7 n=1 Tax=Noviherbaspirillum cavernae TaxID=2320862 RepID=A0A418X1U7_9BURK|nr:entericidin A/B family lipoprotein [Noviherbaspirillum cavernae]RJG06420.1 entericidin, EcnA/B family [Noviherbaspirillum cavernae]